MLKKTVAVLLTIAGLGVIAKLVATRVPSED